MHTIEKINRRNGRRMRENIAEVWHNADQEHRAAGEVWYSEANSLARDLADSSSLSLHATSGIIAVLSPQTSWERNVVAATEVCGGATTTSVPTLGGSLRKAVAIAQGGDPDEYVRGNKVRSFWEIIESPESHAVCVDVHAFNLAVGRICSDKQRKALERVGMYDFFASCYKQVAEDLSIIPHVLQATTWVNWREKFQYAKLDRAISL